MWYFAWALGLGFAAAAAILNALWYELYLADRASGAGPARIAAE